VRKPEPVFPRIETRAAPEEPAPAAAPAEDDSWLDAITDVAAAVAAQGDKVRRLKADKADKAQVEREVAKLLKLKARLPQPTG